jgi:peptidoglycan/xylan/chitin deacetylase (PgdA/CDA1 family)
MMQNPTGFAQYAFEFIFNILGIEAERAGPGELDIYYGNGPADAKIIIRESRSDVIWKDLLEGGAEGNGWVVPFDIVNAIGCLLSDSVNRELKDEAYDEHGRLLYNHSFQGRMNLGHVPLVNLYVNCLKELFEQRLSVIGTSLWKEGKKCVIGLSHDVDQPDKHYFFKNAGIPKNRALREATNFKAVVKDFVKYLVDKERNSFWLFDEIMEEEEKLGLRSTFFFASVNAYDSGASLRDVYYKIGRSDFGRVFEMMKEKGFEIALHASYNAYKEAGSMAYEKALLSESASTDVIGVRNHYLHIGKDEIKTLRLHEAAGFNYDSSLFFPNDMGFKRSTALPFYPYDNETKKRMKCLQLPVFCMDGNLFYHNTTVERAVEEICRFIGNIKKCGGMGVIDWHERTSYPKNSEFFDWGRAYVEVIKYLASDREIWVTSLGEIASWIKEREVKIGCNA